MRAAEKRKEPCRRLAGSAGNYNERPGHLPLAIFLLALVHPAKKRPKDRSRISFGRALKIVQRHRCLPPLGIVGADAVMVVHVKRPKDEAMIVSTNEADVAPHIGLVSDLFMLVAHKRPHLPA